MASTTVTVDIPGIGVVVANNAASEATLKEILKAIQGGEGGGYKKGAKPSDAKKNETKDGGGDGGGGGGNSGKGAYNLGKTLGTMVRPAQMLVGGFMALGASTTSLIQSFANAGDTFSGAAAVFSKVPVLGGIFGAVAGAADKVLGSYQAATASGATFGGSINNFAASASAAGMTMDKFGGLIARNGEALMTLGGTTENGAKQFAQMSKDMRNSKIGEQLYGLGMTTEQVNQGMATYMKIYGANGSLQGKSTKEIAQGAGQYLKELDALAKITGQNREELQKEQEARMKDAQFRAATANLDEKQAKMMNNFISSFPKEQQEAVKEMIATGNITSEAGVMLNNSMPGLAQSIIAQGNAVKSGVQVSQDSYDRIYANGVAEAKLNSKSEDARTQALYNTQQFGNAYIGMAELAKRDIDGKKKAMTEQEKAQAAQAAAMEKAKQNIAAVSNSFQMVLANSGLLNTLMSAFEWAANFTMQYLVPAFQIFSSVISGLWGFIETNLGPAMNSLGNILTTYVWPAFQTLAAFFVVDFLPGVTNAFNNLMPVFAAVADFLLPPIKAVAEFIMDNFTPILIGVAGLLAVWGAGILASNAINLVNNGLRLAESGQLLASIAGFLGVNATLLPFIAIGAAVVVGMTALWIVFKKFGGDLEVIKLGFNIWWTTWKAIMNSFKLGIYELLDLIPGLDYSKEIEDTKADIKKNAETIVEDAAAIQTRMAHNREEADKKEQKREDVKAGLDLKKLQQSQKHGAGMEAANKKEEDARNKQVALNYDDPTALLKGFAQQQNSALIKNPESNMAKSVDGAKQSVVADVEAKTAAEKAAKEKEGAKEVLNAGASGNGSTAAPATTQESPASLLASLNTKMDQLIKHSAQTTTNTYQQVVATKALSHDLYSGIPG